jgi:hypothetical protein
MYGQIVAPGKKNSRISVAIPRAWYGHVVEIEKRAVPAATSTTSAPYEDFKSENEMNEFISGFAKEYFND